MSFPLVALIAFLLIAGVLLLMVTAWRRMRARRLPSALRETLRAEMAGLDRVSDHARRVLDAEKILDHALSALGYRGTFAEKLQQAGPRFSSLQPLWQAHKLRNRIAHERNVTVDGATARRSIAAFARALRDLE